MKEYDIFLPLRYNDGSLIEADKFQLLQTALLEEFAGLTYFPQVNEGFWKLGSITYRDEIVIDRVLAGDSSVARKFLLELKEQLKKDFDQEEILIVERDVDAL